MLRFIAALLLAACASPIRPVEVARPPPPPRVIVFRPQPPAATRPVRGLGKVKLKQPKQPVAAPEADRFARYNLDRINAYRSREGLTPLVLDAKLSAFALEGSRESKAGGPAHGHIGHASKEEFERAGFTKGWWAENQGWCSRLATDPIVNEEKQIASILQGMMNEGPGGGHHDNILAKSARRLGVGIIMDGDGGMTLTNDFAAD